ncbi:MAG: hypothetical protein AAF436_21320 [Myxococcota bacterium]
MTVESGLVFRRNNGSALVDLGAINEELAEIQMRVVPVDLRPHPSAIRQLLCKPSLDAGEAERVKAHFLLSRERLLEVIRNAGREPQVEEGGSLETHVMPHDYSYPQLFQVEEGSNYARFDAFHCNLAEDGSCAVDEVAQFLAGGPHHVLHLTPSGDTLLLTVTCPGDDGGWLVTYSGATPHSGRIGDARIGTKALVQVIGPARWTMDYDVPQGLEPPVA